MSKSPYSLLGDLPFFLIFHFSLKIELILLFLLLFSVPSSVSTSQGSLLLYVLVLENRSFREYLFSNPEPQKLVIPAFLALPLFLLPKMIEPSAFFPLPAPSDPAVPVSIIDDSDTRRIRGPG